MTHTSPFPPDPPSGRGTTSELLPPLLGEALTTVMPAGPVPPGPRMNPWRRAGAVPVPLTGPLRALLDGLWHRGSFHQLPDGTTTSIPRRPVPSAGGTYAVHTHLVIGSSGLAGLGPGRYVYDHEHARLLVRGRAGEGHAGWGRTPAVGEDSQVVLTVQPGRSFGRYRHRAWPLWIADVAYAQMAVEFLLAERLAARTGPGPGLRGLLGVPRATAAEAWLARGLVPEIPLVSLTLPASWSVDHERSRALARRRSPALNEFTREHGRVERAAHVAAMSGQAWVRGADRVETWSVPAGAPAGEIVDALWHAHRCAAVLCYTAALSGRWRCRPVAGIAAAQGRWTMHALAMLSGTRRRDEEDAT